MTKKDRIWIFSLTVVGCLIIFLYSCKKPDSKANDSVISVADKDGNIYKTVTIDTQFWMAENLKTTSYNDGTSIPLVIDSTAWINLIAPGYCWYNNNESANKNLYGKQREFIQTILDYNYVVCLKSRQTGVSTTTQAFCAWLLLFNDNVIIGVISKDGREASRFATIVKGMIDKVPDWIKPPKGAAGIGFKVANVQQFVLTNGSSMRSAVVDPKAPTKSMRGTPVNLLIIDEGSHIDRLQDSWAGLVPALATAQKHARAAGIPYGTVIISTPNKICGPGFFFHSKYMEALENEFLKKIVAFISPCWSSTLSMLLIY